MHYKLLSIAFLVLSLSGYCQEQEVSNKFLGIDYQLVVDNDVFTLDLQQDQYYSSGIYPAVRWLIDSVGTTKRILKAQLNHRVFTPSWIGWENQNQLDRPYAGQLSFTFGLAQYFKSNQYLNMQLELGWMGPGAMVGKTQKTWHRWFRMPEPKGWKYQINNTPIANAYITYIKSIFYSGVFDFSSESNLGLGTVFNYFRQDLTIRLGKINPMNQSAFNGSSLGNRRASKRNSITVESYFFYSPGLEYVIYNATIEGNLIGSPSIYTEDARNWVWQHRAGLMFSWPRFDLGVIAYWRTSENTNATKHDYVGIRLNQRF